MKTIGLVSIALFLFAQSAGAASWAVFGIATTAENAPQVVAATDKLMSSKMGKEFPGKLLLQANFFNGADPTTHSFVPIYKTVAEREAFADKMTKDPAWAEFQATLAKLGKPTGQVLYKTVKSWGDLADTDHVWMGHAFQVRDAAAFLAALEALMQSETGKAFPGQVYLSQVVAAGISPVTHTISVGYASEAEMDAWIVKRDASKDWTVYLEASRKSADYLGAGMVRDVKTWGPATFKDLNKP